MTRVAVIGGGISGLVAAYRLRQLLGPRTEILLLEHDERLGGKLYTAELAGRGFDVGAEAFLNRRPEVSELAAELGISDSIAAPSSASARIRAGGSLHPLPSGTFMGLPAYPELLRPLISPAGIAAMHAERELPALDLQGRDVAVGDLLRARLGDEVVDRLVDPLLSGVYGGAPDRALVDQLSLRATMPRLAEALDSGARSLLEALQGMLASGQPCPAFTGSTTEAADAAAFHGGQCPVGLSSQSTTDKAHPTGRTPVFGAFRGGYRQLVDALVHASGAEVRTRTLARTLRQLDSGWRLELLDTRPHAGPSATVTSEFLDVDGLVLAVPPAAARRLLAPVSADAAGGFACIETSSTVVVGLALPADTPLPEASGVLLARGESHVDGTPFTAKAFTFSSRKWPHLRGSHGEALLRASVSQAGAESPSTALASTTDTELVAQVRQDLAELTGMRAEPVDTIVQRWGGALPRYDLGHQTTVAGIERAVSRLDGIAVAGAALHGVGVPGCVATAGAAAGTLASHLWARHTGFEPQRDGQRNNTPDSHSNGHSALANEPVGT